MKIYKEKDDSKHKQIIHHIKGTYLNFPLSNTWKKQRKKGNIQVNN